MSEIERLLQQQLNALQQQRQNEISSLEQQLNALLQQQELQQQILNSLNMTVVEQTQRCDVLHSAVSEQARCLQNLETVLMGALDSSGSLDVEQLYTEAKNEAMQAMETRQWQAEVVLQQLANGLTELQNSVDALLAQLKR